MRRYYRRIDEAGHTYPEATIYALRQDRQEAARTARDPGVRARIDDLRACYLLVELYEKAASHSITRDEYVTGIRMARSINWYISPIMESSLTAWGEPPAKPPKLPDAPSDGNPDEPVELDEPTDKRIQPMTSDELHRFLDALPIPEPAPGLPAWNHADDGRLLPLGGKGAGFPVGKHVDMGAGFRFGTYTLLIHAKANERRRQA
jgi:hypothetical protein